jgi:hypothetical protein
MNSAILKAVGEAQPELLEKVAKAVFVLEHIHPEFAAELTAEISAITDYTQEKIAGPMDKAVGKVGAGVRPWMEAVGGMVAAGLVGAVATDLYDAAKRGLTKGMNFKRIMEANPDLKKNYDQKDIKTYFNTFHRYAPDFTADPNLGGQILRVMAEIPTDQHQIVKDLLANSKNLRDIRKGQFSMGSNAAFISRRSQDDVDNHAYLLNQKRQEQENMRGQLSNDHEKAHEDDQALQRAYESTIASESAAHAVRSVPNRFTKK